MADNNTLNFDLDAPAVPTLTLDPTPEAAEEKKPEPAPAAQQPEVQLTPEEQAMVDSFAEKIDTASRCCSMAPPARRRSVISPRLLWPRYPPRIWARWVI